MILLYFGGILKVPEKIFIQNGVFYESLFYFVYNAVFMFSKRC